MDKIPGPTQPPFQWVPWAKSGHVVRVTIPATSAEVKERGPAPHVFMAPRRDDDQSVQCP
jgi:hypothetical protein